MRIQKDNVIAFDNVAFNSGDGYNATSGVFRAPRAGYYVINVVCEVKVIDTFRMEMMVKVDTNVSFKQLVFFCVVLIVVNLSSSTS
jgi:hypothetical protein